MFDSIATLYLLKSTSYDSEGNEIQVFEKNTVFCYARGVYHSEYYEAAQNGLHPSVNLTIANREDYHGEMLVGFDGKLYNVIRVDWTASRDKIALVLQERDGTEAIPAETSDEVGKGAADYMILKV